MNIDSHITSIENSIKQRAWLNADGWLHRDILTFMREENIPGVSVAVIEDWKINWEKSYGFQRQGSSEPVTKNTLFQAASISKPVTALAALSLVQEGLLELDEDANAYLTSWHIPPNHGWQPHITLRQLLSHSAGVTVDGFPGYADGKPLPSLIQILKGEQPANTPPIFVDTLPGLHFRYSGGGFTILQQLMEDITHQPFWQIMEERVFRPLGMQHSTFRYPLPATMHPNAAHGHRADGQPIAGGWHTYPELAAAGLWTTPAELALMLLEIENTLRGAGGGVVNRALVEEMVKPQIQLRDLGLTGWEGLSLFLTEEEDGWYCGHGGSNEGFRAQFIIRKGKGQAAVMMTNSDNGRLLTNAWMNSVALEYGWTGFAYHPPAAVFGDPAAHSLLAGRYQTPDKFTFEIALAENGLHLLVEGQPPLMLLPLSNVCYFAQNINAEVTFAIEDNQCVSLNFKQNGEIITAHRMVK